MAIKKFVLRILFCSLVIFTASTGLCMVIVNNIPIVGLWVGNNIMFNISEDGTKITGINSPFPDGGSLIINFTDKYGNTFNRTITAEIPIRNGWIRYQQDHNNGTLKIEGSFVLSDFATGNVSFNGTLNVWHAQPDPSNKPITKPIRTFSGHKDTVWTVKLTPDLKSVVSGSYDKTIKIWEMESGNMLGTLKGHSKRINSLAVSPDGKLLVSAGEDRKIIVWDLNTYKQLNTFKDANATDSLVFIANGRQFVSGAYNGVIKIREINTGKPLRLLEGHRGIVRYLLITNDGNILISAGNDNTIKIWDLEDGSLLNTLSGHAYSIFKITLSPDGKKLASVSFDNTVKVWDLATGQTLLTLAGHYQTVIAVAITPDGKRIISGSWDNTIRVWDLETGTLLKMFYTRSGGACDIIALPDGKQFMSGLGNGTIKFWDLEGILSEEEVQK